MVDPGGNSITSFRSQSTKCPPRLGWKGPRAVMAHHPNGRFAGSVWSKEQALGPKLKVQQAKMLLRKFRFRRGYLA
jgi:hypothetical protein